MSKQIIIAEQHRVAAVFSEDQIEELVVAQGSHQIGDIYLGLVENILPGIDAAFVNIGDRERNGFIHVGDLGPVRLHRNSRSITELLHPQQKVLVQVMKEPTGSKGPRLTGNVSLPGRYLVLMPFRKGVNLSRRILSENERSRLRALAVLVKPAGMGLLVRTEAEGVAEEAIIEDLEVLQNQWATVQEESQTTRPPALLNRDDDFVQRVLRDVFSVDVNRIVVDSAHGLKRVKQHLMTWSSGRMPQGVFIDQHRERTSILEYFRVEAAIREALKPRVDLPSGGYIIIEPTEALTVIDVNSGSFTQSATARETVLWTNSEAATEIARQLRLRNVAGVIVVDFIDMESRRDQLQVLKHFEEALKLDKARPQIAQLTELGLVELTRKRQGQNIYELFGQTCSHCGGHGYTVQIPGLVPSGGSIFAPPSLVDSTPSYPPAYVPPELRSGRPQPVLSIPPVATPWVGSDWTDEEEDEEETPLETAPEPIPSYYNETENRVPNRRRRRRPGDALAPEFPLEESAPPDLEPTPSRYREPSGEAIETGGRYGTRRSRSPIRPAEVVTVEMTPAQQEVYAWMGVSPLVLAPELADSSRNIVIHVVEPGTQVATIAPQGARSEAETIDSDSAVIDSGVNDREETPTVEFETTSTFGFRGVVKPAPILATHLTDPSGDSSDQESLETDEIPKRNHGLGNHTFANDRFSGLSERTPEFSPPDPFPDQEASPPANEDPAPIEYKTPESPNPVPEEPELDTIAEARRRRRRSSALRTESGEE